MSKNFAKGKYCISRMYNDLGLCEQEIFFIL